MGPSIVIDGERPVYVNVNVPRSRRLWTIVNPPRQSSRSLARWSSLALAR